MILTLREEEWKLEENLVLKEEKVYVPKDEELRAEVIWLHHDVPAVVLWDINNFILFYFIFSDFIFIFIFL